jgi:hypothetical protein
MDQDGYPDIVTSDSGGLRVFFNNHDLTFPVHPLSATSTSVSSIAIGNLNGDKYPDIVISEAFQVAVMLNDGTGAFPTEVRYTVGSVATQAPSVAIGDVNHDGIDDVVYAEQYQVGVFINDGKGKLTAQASSPYTAGHLAVDSPHSVALAKIDADDYLDLIAVNYGSTQGSVGIFINKGDGSFAPQVSYATTANNNASAGFHGDYRPAATDLDGDGDVDLCVPTWGNGNLGVFINAGNGTFGAQQTYPAGFFPNSCLAADFNGDGHVDLAASTNESNGEGAAGVFFARCQ